MGCGTKEDLDKIKKKLKKSTKDLNVEEIKNKDPLIILRDIMTYNTDADIIQAIRVQNKHLLKDIKENDIRIDVKYRRKARNPLNTHVVLKVSP